MHRTMMMDTPTREGNPKEATTTASGDTAADGINNTQGTVYGSTTNSPKNGTVPEAAKDQTAPAPADEELVTQASGGQDPDPATQPEPAVRE